MRPSSAPVRRQGRACSSTSRSSIIGSACTQPSAIALQLKPGPAWRRSLCARQHDILIASLHSQGGSPVYTSSGAIKLLENKGLWSYRGFTIFYTGYTRRKVNGRLRKFRILIEAASFEE